MKNYLKKTIVNGFLTITKFFAIILIAFSISMAVFLVAHPADSQLAVNVFLSLFSATAATYQYHIAKNYVENLEHQTRESPAH